MNHRHLTVCSIDGVEDGRRALPAISESLEQLPGSRGLLVSVSKPDNLPAGIEWRQTQPLSYLQYSVFVFHCLAWYVKTDYVLIVQRDGWTLSGENFSEHYYSFDFVGAPCHAAIVGGLLYQRYQWPDTKARIVIQNGGFSLRSKKLLEVPSIRGIVYNPNQTPPLCNEDVQLSGTRRAELADFGVVVADDAAAKQFSVEYLGPCYHDGIDLTKIVGHHAATRVLTSRREVTCTIPEAMVCNVHGETEVLAFIESLGYRIRFSG